MILAEQATALQFGYHEPDEILIVAGSIARRKYEAITGGTEPLFHLVGDLLWRSDEGWELGERTALRKVHEIGRRGIGAPAQPDDTVAERLYTGYCIHLLARERLIIALRRGIEIEHLGQQHQSVDRLGEAGHQRLLILRLGLRLADDGVDGGRDPCRIPGAADLVQQGLELA